jgi:hypothetical protein
MNDQLDENLDKAQEPLLYVTSGTLTLGEAFTVSQGGVLNVAGGGIVPGSTVNCGTF